MFDWVKRLMSGPPAAAPVPAPTPAPPPPMAAPTAAPAAAPTGTLLQFDQKELVNDAFYRWLFDTHEQGDFELTEVERQVLDTLQHIRDNQQSGATLVRRMPGVLPQLMQCLRSENFSVAQLSKMLSNDVVLVAGIIRLANSSMVGTNTPITSLEHAIMVIGQEGLRQLVTTVAFRPIIDVNSGPFTRAIAPRLWDQSERSAIASRSLAAGVGGDPFEGFLAGLLQNVGLIVSMRVMDQAAKHGEGIGSALFTSQILPITRALAIDIGKEWALPPASIQAVSEQGSTRKGASLSALGHLLSLSDYLSKAKLLVDAERLSANEPLLFRGLPEPALSCFAELNAAPGP